MNAIASTQTRTGRARTTVLWVLAALGAASFLMAGFQKLSSDPGMVQLFSLIGFGPWFRYLTGTLETLGAIALLIPRLRVLGALGLIGVMVGAILTNALLHAPQVPALVELVIVAAVAWGRRRELSPAWILHGQNN
ncbi:DoxX family protein [Pseudonocardia sp. Cha107L01]|uniref:DoxX family protein n=1 Tax=Pseudonocardia sp. Cha107L01 TaxID=3457576 RepID=UPI00403EED2C